MIYIFDDRAQRRKDNEEKLKELSDLITFKTVDLTPGKSVEESIIDSIEDSECIIFHKSYVFEDKSITFETIRDLFISLGVPIVIFSGGTEGSNKNSNVENIMNADLMYENLPYFLEDFKVNGEINIDTLLWGKRYRLNAILQFQNKISETYLINNDPDDIIDNIPTLKRFIYNSCRKINKGLGDSIIADIDSHTQITWLELSNIIDNQIEKYK